MDFIKPVLATQPNDIQLPAVCTVATDNTIYHIKQENKVCTISQELHYSDNLLIHSTAPTCFDIYMSSSESLLLCVLLSCIKIYMVCDICQRSLHSVVVVNKTLKCN
jgi:hypothetical protein